MKLPRDLSGTELVKLLSVYGYQQNRQRGSHIRLVTLQKGEHFLTVPNHTELRVGTLASILDDVADHFAVTREEVVRQLFGA